MSSKRKMEGELSSGSDTEIDTDSILVSRIRDYDTKEFDCRLFSTYHEFLKHKDYEHLILKESNRMVTSLYQSIEIWKKHKLTYLREINKIMTSSIYGRTNKKEIDRLIDDIHRNNEKLFINEYARLHKKTQTNIMKDIDLKIADVGNRLKYIRDELIPTCKIDIERYKIIHTTDDENTIKLNNFRFDYANRKLHSATCEEKKLAAELLDLNDIKKYIISNSIKKIVKQIIDDIK